MYQFIEINSPNSGAFGQYDLMPFGVGAFLKKNLILCIIFFGTPGTKLKFGTDAH